MIAVCALQSGAQTLTATYVELADSADRYIRSERWADAERVIVKALRHEPANKSNYLLWSNLGMVRHEQRNYEGAVMAYDIGLASAPRSTSLLSNRARTYLALGKRGEARADIEQALSLDSALQWPRKMRGILRSAEGDTVGAMRDFRIYLDRYPEDAAVDEAMGDIAARGGDIDRALELYSKAYKLEPDEEIIGKKLLTAYSYGRFDAMRKDLADAMKKYPRSGQLYLIRALYHKAMYQTEAMEQDIELARKFGVEQQTIDSFF